jgi:hypothetical protein
MTEQDVRIVANNLQHLFQEHPDLDVKLFMAIAKSVRGDDWYYDQEFQGLHFVPTAPPAPVQEPAPAPADPGIEEKGSVWHRLKRLILKKMMN